MRGIDQDPVIAALRDPSALVHASLQHWDELLRDARRADLLARIACELRQRGLTELVPPQPRAHLLAEELLVAAHGNDVRREVMHIAEALAPLRSPVVLLKGAAYVMSNTAAARGRLFADVDILVPEARLAEVEAALMARGWATTHLDAYDQRYYREWMHELPPMENIHRNTVLDVHHAIAPRTARIQADTRLLLQAAPCVQVGGHELHVLARCDMILHSMVHLFCNDDLSHGLRDLSDIDLLVREASKDSAFWAQLQARAEELGLRGTLRLGLRHAHAILQTPVPIDVDHAASRFATHAWRERLMDRAWRAVLATPPAPGQATWGTRAALSLLYLRAHWLRMPPWLLLKHLAVKGARRLRGTPTPTGGATL